MALTGNCTADDLKVGDRIVVTHGRTFARTRVTITERNGNGTEVRFDYVTATGAHGHVWTERTERWTRVAA